MVVGGRHHRGHGDELVEGELFAGRREEGHGGGLNARLVHIGKGSTRQVTGQDSCRIKVLVVRLLFVFWC